MGVPVRLDQRFHWRVGGPDLTDRQHLLHERPPGAHLPASGTFASRGAGARSRRLARGQGLAGAGEHHASALAAVFAGTQCRGKAVGIPQATLLEQPHLPRLPGAIHPDDGGLESPSPGSSSLFVFHRLGRAHDLKEKRIIVPHPQNKTITNNSPPPPPQKTTTKNIISTSSTLW